MEMSVPVYKILNDERVRRQVSVSSLARVSGVDKDALYACFGGKRKISGEELIILCDILELSLEDIKNRRTQTA